jgi:hypothetical protein
MATKIGTFVYIKLGAGAASLVGESSTSFKSAQTMIEVSSKASGQNSDFEAGRINRTISVSSLASTDPAATGYGFEDALAAQVTGTKIAFLITAFSGAGNKISGDSYISGNAHISNVSWDVPDNDKMTFSCDLQVTEGITVDVNTTVAAPTGTATQAKTIGQTVSNLTAPTGTGIQGYASTTGMTALAGTVQLISGNIYYASQTVAGVESVLRLAVTVTLS